MKDQSKVIRLLSVVIFSTGVILGMAFNGVAVWGGLESYLFDATIRADATLTTLKCPVILTAIESGMVHAVFHNPTERVVTPTIRARISDGYVTLMREINTRLSLEPGETSQLQWVVDPEDAAFGRLILVRVHMMRYPPLPYRSASCGIVVLNLPFLTGIQIVAAMITTSLMGLVIGGSLWFAGNRPLQGRILHTTKGMGFLGGAVLLGMIAGLSGWWFFGGLSFLIAALLIIEIIAYYAITS